MPAVTSTERRRQNGYTIRALRTKERLSQTELADYAGIRQSTLSDIETERCDGQFTTLVAIARALAVPVAAILRAAADEDAAA